MREYIETPYFGYKVKAVNTVNDGRTLGKA